MSPFFLIGRVKANPRGTELRYRIAAILLSLCLVAALLGLLTIGMEDFHKYQAFRERETIYRDQLRELETEQSQQTAYLNAVLNDPKFREDLIRERLGYVRDGEVIIRFEE